MSSQTLLTALRASVFTKNGTARSLAIVAVVGCIAAPPADAQPIKYQTAKQLHATCSALGGDYQAPGSKNGAYSCMLPGGEFISCGGVGQYATTCNNGPLTGTPDGPPLPAETRLSGKFPGRLSISE